MSCAPKLFCGRDAIGVGTGSREMGERDRDAVLVVLVCGPGFSGSSVVAFGIAARPNQSCKRCCDLQIAVGVVFRGDERFVSARRIRANFCGKSLDGDACSFFAGVCRASGRVVVSRSDRRRRRVRSTRGPSSRSCRLSRLRARRPRAPRADHRTSKMKAPLPCAARPRAPRRSWPQRMWRERLPPQLRRRSSARGRREKRRRRDRQDLDRRARAISCARDRWRRDVVHRSQRRAPDACRCRILLEVSELLERAGAFARARAAIFRGRSAHEIGQECFERISEPRAVLHVGELGQTNLCAFDVAAQKFCAHDLEPQSRELTVVRAFRMRPPEFRLWW